MSRSSLLVLICVVACAPSRELVPEPQTGVSNLDVHEWAGGEELTHDGNAAIELSDGARFEVLLATTTYEGDAEPRHCSLYGLRFSDGVLEEGRRSLACDVARNADASTVPFSPVDESRRAHLRAVLAGAALATQQSAIQDTRDQIVVRVETDQGVVEDQVPPTAWPEPYAEVEPPRGRSPEGLAELWEAVMYPERYRSAPGSSAP